MTSMEDLSLHIRTVCELPLVMDTPTPGRGNCFFAGVCQQLRRLELHSSQQYTAATLRKELCNFALEKSNHLIQNLAQQHDENAAAALRFPWDVFFNQMKRSGTFAEGPVLHTTAIMLERDIAVISFGNSRNNPYLHIPADPSKSSKFPPIYLGNLINLHFQSFVPDVGVDIGRLQVIADQYVLNDEAPAKKTKLAPLVDDEAPIIVAKPKPKLFSTPRTTLKKKKVTPVREIQSMGDTVMTNVMKLVKENRRLHAMVKELEWKLQHRDNEEGGGAAVENYFSDNDDSATDEFILSSPCVTDDSFVTLRH